MAKEFPEGAKVTWHWGAGTGEGVVCERFERRVQRTIKGTRIVRNGTGDNPAYLVETDDGGHVLKRGSELSAS
ncbi:DUF2945 domain-containing protein [Sphingobium sufflavum]|uniref:DUF2945 domain-containing protein n=1 Tax=Sphingobium sufflavum TaxID=1129547 RepID=UPI001F3B7262|nr:DUF2945 domain-containing protein [Sphingobium sufflavum]MCE7796360.1 DUF2945 domain-containing protein [Sphingobium sufflavum]